MAKKLKEPPKSRKWFLTIHKEKRWTTFLEWVKENVDRISYIFVSGVEFTKKKLPHVHVFLYMRNAWRRKSLMRIVKMDARIALGDDDDTKLYTKKATTPPILEFGTPPQQGDRTDIEYIRDMIKDGKSDEYICDEVAGACRMIGMLSKIRFAYQKKLGQKIRPKIVAEWRWSHASGTGKTYFLQQLPQDQCFWVDFEADGNCWFDGYEGEKYLIFDELTHAKASKFKRIVDNSPYRCGIKGSMAYAQWTHVFVCSNYPPEQVFLDHRDAGPVLRRFKVIEFTDVYKPGTEVP